MYKHLLLGSIFDTEMSCTMYNVHGLSISQNLVILCVMFTPVLFCVEFCGIVFIVFCSIVLVLVLYTGALGTLGTLARMLIHLCILSITLQYSP